MHIYIQSAPGIRNQLQGLSDELYGGMHAGKGLTDFYFGFVEEEDSFEVIFEILGTQKQIAFIELIDGAFEIIEIESAEDGEEEERQAMEWWETTNPSGTVSQGDQ